MLRNSKFIHYHSLLIHKILKQLASCFGIKCTQSMAKICVHIESPVKVTCYALEVPQGPLVPCRAKLEQP